MFAILRKLPLVRRACYAFAAVAVSTSVASAQASLSGSLMVDNSFRAYLSSSATQAGVEIASGTNWTTTYAFSNAALTAGQDYWLHITAVDVGVIAAFMGSFSITGSGFEFSNGLQSLTTDTQNWLVSSQGYGIGEETPMSWGANGVGPWGTRPGLPSNAQAIWSADGCINCTRYFSTSIVSTTVVPEPSAVALLAVGLLMLGAVAHRKRSMLRDR